MVQQHKVFGKCEETKRDETLDSQFYFKYLIKWLRKILFLEKQIQKLLVWHMMLNQWLMPRKQIMILFLTNSLNRVFVSILDRYLYYQKDTNSNEFRLYYKKENLNKPTLIDLYALKFIWNKMLNLDLIEYLTYESQDISNFNWESVRIRYLRV